MLKPQEILAWARREHPGETFTTTSFQISGLVLLHLLKDIAPEPPTLCIEPRHHLHTKLPCKARTARNAAPSTDYLASKGIAAVDMAKFKDLGSDDCPTSDVESAYTSYAMIQVVMLKKKRRGKK